MKAIKLNHKNIRPYGCIIDSKFLKDDGAGNKFCVLLKERSRGWRIGYLVARDKIIERLESHPDSLETFEPMKGKAVIAFASNRSPKKTKLFFLDKPIVVKKRIWHEVAAISKKCEIKIFENIEVTTRYYYLKHKIKV